MPVSWFFRLAGGSHGRRWFADGLLQPMDYQTLVQRRCVMCHSSGPHQIDFNNRESLNGRPSVTPMASTIAQAIEMRLQGMGVPQMPMGDRPLSADEQRVVMEGVRAVAF